MTALANRPRPAYEYGIKVISGPDTGSTYKIVSSSITIGRSSDNDIIINHDTKCSRQHAQIIFDTQGIKIIRLSDNNSIKVNGHEIERAFLENKSIILIGGTKLQFIIKSTAPSISKRPHNISSNNHPSSQEKSKKTFYTLLLVVAAFFIFILSEDSKKNLNKLDGINNDQLIEDQVEERRKVLKAFEKQKFRSGKNSIMYKQAQASYLKGFRDFKYGLYSRSIDSLQACLSLQPNHTLCKRYINLSKIKFDELIQENLRVGLQYKNQNQYAACKKTYQNVMFLLKDRTSKTFQEARSNFIYCNTLMKGAY